MTKEEREKAIDVFERKHLCMYTDCLSVRRLCSECPRNTTADEMFVAITTALEALKQEPREHGEWIQEEYWSEGCGMGESYGHWFRCSKCGNRVKDGYKKCGLNFCNKCGADMRKVKNNV